MLGLVYLFLFRVVRAVWAELAPPRRADDSAPPRQPRGGTGVPQSSAPPGASAPLPPPAAIPSPRPPAAASKAVPAQVPGRQATGSELVVVAPAELAGNRFTLSGAELTVGRGGGCSVVLDDSFVSQVHARLVMTGGRWQVEDLESTNGTWVNADRVVGPRPLSVGDHLAMGSVVMELR
jgi:pSer/pThr/pTyr-binding forkhead associated (FHA) protein